MKIRLKLLISISLLVLLYAAYYWGIPAILDVQHKIPVVQKMLKKELGADVEIKNPKLKMGLSPSVWLEADSFSFKDKKSRPLELENAKLKINLLPLIIGKIHLAYLSCDKINADLKIDKNYHLYIGNYLIMRTTNPKISVEDSQMHIENYTIKLKDELQNKKVLLQGDYFNLEKYNSKKYIKCSINSKLKINERLSVINAGIDLNLPFKKGLDTNEITFEGTITNLNLADFSPYIKKISKSEIKQIKGILNIEADTKILNRKTSRIKTQMAIEDLFILAKNSPPIYFKNKLNILSALDISKNQLKINNLKFSSGRINANIVGKIKKISSPNPIIDLTLIVGKSRIEDFISLLPGIEIKNSEINLIALKKYKYYSDLEGRLAIKGKADRPKITGEFLSSNAYLIKPLPSNIQKATAKINFLGEKLYMDINVPVAEHEKITVKGNVELYGTRKYALDIESTPNIDLGTTVSILNPLHEIFYFEIGPLPLMQLKGNGNIHLKFRETKQNPRLFGSLTFKNAEASFNGFNMIFKDAEGRLDFKDRNTFFTTKKAMLDGKNIGVKGNCTLRGELNYDILANGQNLELLLKVLNTSPLLSNLQKAVPQITNANGQLNIALKLKGKVSSLNDIVFGKTILISGNIKLLGNNILFTSLQMPIKNLFGTIKFNNFDADFDLYSLVEKSKIIIKGKVRNKVLSSKIKLDDIAFVYFNIPIKIFSGNLEINNDKLTLYKVNAALDSMPVVIDGMATNIFKKPNFNIYINSKPSQKFIEKYMNKNTTYPLKLKGDITCSSRIDGTTDSFNTKTEMMLKEGASIYYMGSTLGDANSPIRIYLDADISKNYTFINNFQYDKIDFAPNNREVVSQQLNAKGQINFLPDNITFHNFRIRTQNPTDAKIFNIIFKKPLIKKGLFSSNIIINNAITSPKLFGSLNFTGIDIPLLDTTIKDISLDFNDNTIDIKAKGEIFSNQILLLANMENRLIPPYIFNDVDFYLGNLDINQIIKSLKKLELENNMNKVAESKNNNANINITDLMIKQAKIKAQSVTVKNLFAKDLTANFSLNEKLLFSVDNFKFDVAQGKVNGNLNYNLLNSNSAIELHVNGVNANAMADALFDLPNQVYGSLTGEVDLTCNGKSHKTCMETLSGKGGFNIKDGKMPKLGSLEYLLKAANLVKSGITGLTINSILDLVTPLKTGQFDNINGMFSIKSGIADEIQIFSKGKDLSLFLTGTYNFSTIIADMHVFGRISKKISNVLGPVGNTSLNTLFNTIPGLNLDETEKTDFVKNFNKIPGFELNDKTYRIFSVEIYGDINGDDYVQSFKWVE